MVLEHWVMVAASMHGLAQTAAATRSPHRHAHSQGKHNPQTPTSQPAISVWADNLGKFQAHLR